MLFFGHRKLLLLCVGDDGRETEVGGEAGELVDLVVVSRAARRPDFPLIGGHSCVANGDGDRRERSCNRWDGRLVLGGGGSGDSRRQLGHALDVVEIIWATGVVDWADAAQIEGVGCAERAVGDRDDGSLHKSEIKRRKEVDRRCQLSL